MRILHIHTRYRQLGGEDRVVDEERVLLSRSGHTIIPYDAQNSPSPIGAASQLASSPWNLRSAMRVRDAILQGRPDVAHVHNTWFAASPSVTRAITRERVPVVMTLHNYRATCIAATLTRDGTVCELCVGNAGWAGIRYRCYRESLAGSLAATVTNWTARYLAYDRVTRFLALTDFARDLFIRAGISGDRISVVPNFSPDPGSRRAPPSKSETVLFVGRLAPEKGIDMLLDAWARARPRLRLQVIGDGPLADSMRKRHPTVDFLGSIPSSEVTTRMMSARALLFPSQWYEGQSLVVLEAMAAGLPVLASDWPPIRDTLTGQPERWFQPAGDVTSWVRGIRAIENDADIDSVSSSVRERYDTMHTPARAIERLMEVYRLAAQEEAE